MANVNLVIPFQFENRWTSDKSVQAIKILNISNVSLIKDYFKILYNMKAITIHGRANFGFPNFYSIKCCFEMRTP